AILIVGALFDGNWLKGPVQGLASAALEREVEIAGDLDVDLSTTPTVRTEQGRLANAPCGSRPHILSIPEVAVAVRLSSLLRGDDELMIARARARDLLLETNEQGEGNCEFAPPDEPAGAPPTPIIEDLQITHAAIRYRVPGREQDLLAQLDTVAGAISGAGL